ncbi:MAG TPA: MerR family transcriptional regulator, partial [Acidimicrobiales bacterium]|nr:MerR family transcriptional regulator [Acidimicrobiales bacterium]
MTIGALATAAGISVETIRYYERRGLLPAPGRTGAGYRQYSGDDLWRLGFIRRAKDLGFTLAEITELLGRRTDRSVLEVLAAAQAKLAQ